ncbi:MAG TPA: hypothetical protein VMS55_13960 [Myxococcota bacterium]|nr:hypothetical protein [Myxococcota bacterium]
MKRIGIGSLATMAGAAALLGFAAPATAQDGQDGCVYNRQVYAEGTEMCQSGDLVRCEDGAWSDEGDCPDQPMPPPDTGGGDVDADPGQ